jgi:hypothetical protein
MITLNVRLIYYGSYAASPWTKPESTRKEEFDALIMDAGINSNHADVEKAIGVFVREIISHPRTMTKLRLRSYGSCRETTLSPIHKISSAVNFLEEMSSGITSSVYGYYSISNDENYDLTEETFKFFQWFTFYLSGGNWASSREITQDKNTMEFPYNSVCCSVPVLSMYFLIWRCLKQFYPLFIQNLGHPLLPLSPDNGGLLPYKQRINGDYSTGKKVEGPVPDTFLNRKKFLGALGKTVTEISTVNHGFTGYGQAEKFMFNYLLWYIDNISHGMPWSAKAATGCNGILTYIKRDLITANGFTFLEYAQDYLKEYPEFNFPSFMLNNFNMKGTISEKLVKLIDKENKKGEKKDDSKKESTDWASV